MITSARVTAVDASLVHKYETKEVLLTGSHPTGTDTFTVMAHWPEQHSFYAPVGRYSDPLLAVEAIRQAIPFLCHTAYGVPLGHRQAWSQLTYSFNAAVLAEYPATDLDLLISCHDIVHRAGRLSSMSMHVALVRNGCALGTAKASFTNHPPAIYQRLRKRYADLEEALSRALPVPAPLPPEDVARQHVEDVLLSPTGRSGVYRLRVDTKHPILFDHPVDHAPGMVLLEAARQAAHTAVARGHVADAMNVTFSHYAELDAPCWVETSVLQQHADHAIVRTFLRQNEREIFRADVTMRRTEPSKRL